LEKFGQYLLRNQIVSQDQLNEALQCQVIFGGRLGTNLVELGYLTLDDLARLLSRRSGVPAASVEELEDLPKETLGSIPKALVEKFKIIPIKIEAKTLHVAVCDPTDLKTMDEIAFSTGMRVKPYLLPELRMFYLLEKHYGLKRDIRYIRLGRSMSRGRYAGQMAQAASAGPATIVDPPPAPPAPPPADLESKGFRPLRAGEELTDEHGHESFVTPAAGFPKSVPEPSRPLLSVVPPPADADEGALPEIADTHLEPLEATPLPPELLDAPVELVPPSSPTEAEALRAILQTAIDREAVAKAALRLARAQFAACALFIVNKDLLLGWKAAGGLLDRQPIESLMLPASADSILKGPAAGQVFQGVVPKGGLNDRLLGGLGRKHPISAVVVPLMLKNRVVNLFYADNGDKGINAASAGYLQLLVKDIAAAYERIILAKKRLQN
jgi:hypothetical protein